MAPRRCLFGGRSFAAMSHGSFKATNPRVEDVVSYLESIQAK